MTRIDVGNVRVNDLAHLLARERGEGALVAGGQIFVDAQPLANLRQLVGRQARPGRQGVEKRRTDRECILRAVVFFFP